MFDQHTVSTRERRINPVPCFWEFEYENYHYYMEWHKNILDSLHERGFTIIRPHGYDKSYIVSHKSPKHLTLWLLTNQDLCAKSNVTITSYTHNTRKNHHDTPSKQPYTYS